MSLVVDHISHVYMAGGPYETRALDDVSMEIRDGEFVALIGHTGCGKSTLVQHLNGLLKPSSGRVLIDGEDLAGRDVDRRAIRMKVGLVFQYAETQLFEETVARDIAFGPRNLGLPEEEIGKRVREAMEKVGLDYGEIADRSVFELSGGQMRRVAIAGILAMHPEVLVLDEPCAGLDPRGRNGILEIIRKLHREQGTTIIMVSHSMEDVASLAERVVVMDHGRIVMDGAPREVFARGEELRRIGLDVPQGVELVEKLKARGIDLPEGLYRIGDIREAIVQLHRKGDRRAE